MWKKHKFTPTEAIKITTLRVVRLLKSQWFMTIDELKDNVEKAWKEIRPFLKVKWGIFPLFSIDNDISVK